MSSPPEESYLAAIVASSTDAIFSAAPDQGILSWNQAATELYGRSAEEMVGQDPLDLVSGDARAEMALLVERVLGGERVIASSRHHGAAGPLPVTIALSPIETSEGIVAYAAIVRDERERLEAEQRLRESEARYRLVIENASDMILRLDPNGTVLFASPQAHELCGRAAEALLGCHWIELVHQDDRDLVEASLMRARDDIKLEYRLAHPQQEWIWVETSARPVIDPELGVIVELQTATRDISERKLAAEQLAAANDLFSHAFTDAPIGMALLDPDSRPLRVNDALAAMLGRSTEELFAAGVLADIAADGRPAIDDWLAAAHRQGQSDAPQRPLNREILIQRHDGAVISALLSLSAVRDSFGDVAYFIVQFQDISERKVAEAELTRLALKDPLTGLPNRTLLLDSLEAAIARAQRDESTVAILFIDLDRFKLINDSLGHASGDRILIEIARRLTATLRPGDIIARFGSDEFAVLCEHVADEADVISVAERIADAIAPTIRLDDHELILSSSIGIALSTAGQSRAETVIRDAEAAMYRAKEAGKSRFELFSDRIRAEAVRRLETEQALHRAIDHGELRLFYQPQIELTTGRVIGVEALVRWQHPEHGLIAPEQFIALAEETGIIVPIGLWVIKQALSQAARWQQQWPTEPWLVSINLSERQLHQPQLIEQLAAEIESSGVDPAHLCFEIIENVVVHDTETIADIFRRLHQLGVKLAIDDFGTGFAGMTHLRAFELDILKLDRSFIADLDQDPQAEAIAGSIISLAHELGLATVAEGIENPQQLKKLQQLGCHFGQGFLWSGAEDATQISLMQGQLLDVGDITKSASDDSPA